MTLGGIYGKPKCFRCGKSLQNTQQNICQACGRVKCKYPGCDKPTDSRKGWYMCSVHRRIQKDRAFQHGEVMA